MAYWAGMKCENRPLESFQKFSLKAFDRWRASHRFSNFIMSKTRAGKTTAGDSAEQLRTVKRERFISDRVETHPDVSTQPARQCTAERRMLRSKYLAVMNKMNEKRDDLERPDSMKFKTFIGEVENLHQQVQKPREQVADAEALLDLTNTLVMCVKSQYSEGITPSDFIFCLFRNFGQSNGAITIQEDAQKSVCWKDIGLDVSHIFSKARGCCTMLGPMNTELKKRKTVVGRKRSRPTETVKPEELDDTQLEEKTDTDKNMSIIFEILKREKRVRLDCLIFNRMSFAQTVENLFALSFLVKDGRAEITVDANGSHLVSPRNAPSSNSVMSRDVAYSHFVFRFDFKDWKLMMDVVAVGKELMPRRNHSSSIAASQMATAADNSQAALPTSPIRKFSKNRGRVLLEGSVIQQSFESNDEVMIPVLSANFTEGRAC